MRYVFDNINRNSHERVRWVKTKKQVLLFLLVFVLFITLTACGGNDEKTPQQQETDNVKPEVSLNVSSTVYVGEEVSISYQVSDNKTASANLVVYVKVITNGREIAVSDNKFIPDEKGEYTIIVTAVDEAGNSNKVSQVVQAVSSDTDAPTVEILNETIALSGKEITVEYFATDNVTADDDITIKVVVKNTDSNEEVELNDNTFIPVAGNYTITVEAIDEEGNSHSVSKNIVVNDISYREDRDFTQYAAPTNEVNEGQLPLVDSSAEQEVLSLSDGTMAMIHGDFRLDFVKQAENNYTLQLVNINGLDKKTVYSKADSVVMFVNNTPVMVYMKNGSTFATGYDSLEQTSYGICASKTLVSTGGTEILVQDLYYFAAEKELGAFNVRKVVKIVKAGTDAGFASEYGFANAKSGNAEWFVPNVVFKSYSGSSTNYKETALGVPMIMCRNTTNGYTLSISRYKPVVTYIDNSYASLKLDNTNKAIYVSYPSADSGRLYHGVSTGAQHVYDLTIRAEITDSYETATPSVYNAHFNLQNQRIVNTDIDEVYSVICEDYKVFLHATEQEDELSGKKYTSYGLPWRITIENGLIGPMSYQAGFVGQQIPCAYNMMLYGVKYNDKQSLENGIKVINFWIHDAKMMTSAGVPMIWYDGASNRWLGYPTFTRMAVDAMEGLFDAYRLAVANGIEVNGWIEAITACAEWLVKAQNSDGSWYRCYNYQGTYYKGTESDITWNPGNIAKSTSKNNSTMPVRFLGKMYEFTGEAKYLNAVKKAGNFIYNNLYTQHAYFGGTCDNPDCMDKEAGVYAMYAYDTLYTLTGDEKWIECLEQATVFTMSSVITFSFKIPDKASDLKAAYSLECGYTDGLSYITCMGTSIDNYAAYIYYQLFRLYVHTGKEVYYKMAEFIQQNTKSTMDWDGVLGYAYKSLTPEASTIYAFGYASAKDDDGVMGVWLPWQSAANAEPIAKMMDTFGVADVRDLKNTSIEELRRILKAFGVGGNVHRKF